MYQKPTVQSIIDQLKAKCKENGSTQTSIDQFLSAFEGERSEVDTFLNKALEQCKEAGLQLTELYNHPAVGIVYSVKLV